MHPTATIGRRSGASKSIRSLEQIRAGNLGAIEDKRQAHRMEPVEPTKPIKLPPPFSTGPLLLAQGKWSASTSNVR